MKLDLFSFTTFLALALVSLFTATIQAHPAYLTEGEVIMQPDGRFRLEMKFDTLAYALNDTSARIGNEPMEALLAGPRPALEAALADAKGRFLHGLKVLTDRGPGQVDSIHFPTAAEVLEWKASVTPLLPVVLPVQLTGRLPAEAKSVTFQFPKVLTQVVLTAQLQDEEPVIEAVEEGTPSTPFSLVSNTTTTAAAPTVAASPRPAIRPAAPETGRGSAGIDRGRVPGWGVWALGASVAGLGLFWTWRALSMKRLR